MELILLNPTFLSVKVVGLPVFFEALKFQFVMT